MQRGVNEAQKHRYFNAALLLRPPMPPTSTRQCLASRASKTRHPQNQIGPIIDKSEIDGAASMRCDQRVDANVNFHISSRSTPNEHHVIAKENQQERNVFHWPLASFARYLLRTIFGASLVFCDNDLSLAAFWRAVRLRSMDDCRYA
jgi:hypothetical protein